MWNDPQNNLQITAQKCIELTTSATYHSVHNLTLGNVYLHTNNKTNIWPLTLQCVLFLLVIDKHRPRPLGPNLLAM